MAIDVIQDEDMMKSYTESFILWPKKWHGFDGTKYLCRWKTLELSVAQKDKVPEKSGVYTLLVQPNIAAHPACSFLMYVGQAQSLQQRFQNYLTVEKKHQKRPKIFRLLNKYDSYVWFCYTLVDMGLLDDYENALMEAFIPPKNSDNRLPASIRSIRGAF